MGTSRSIPIKNYRISIGQSIDTLRRSLPPKYQLENAKRLDSFKWQKQSSDLRSVFGFKTSEGPPLINEHRLSRQSNGVNMECQTPTETADPDASPDSLESGNIVDNVNNHPRCSASTLFSNKKTANKKLREVPNLESGHVVQKISAYEKNSCCVRRERWSHPRSGMTEMMQRKSIGVPLVGMHNTCGLPDIAHWQRLTLSKSSSGEKVLRGHRYLRSRSQKHPKIREPQDLGGIYLRTGWSINKEGSSGVLLEGEVVRGRHFTPKMEVWKRLMLLKDCA
ncbi:uncharacterized protein LOC117173457 [Belonocnema kinseyi]|uniref:uncharacterized protein LOC117173457 n=1 Tax=Belonocnema kinseyi TaxID=2817044 RepID=UPI00143DA710|nr:uncharacterized protein LOC117173457 [Belonocnema kinseyi]